MRKIIGLMHVSFDGFVAGSKREMDWIHLSDELFEDVHNLVKTADTALYGRVTYELMESYWPTAAEQPNATKHVIERARWVNPAPKIVFSKTLEEAKWQNARIVRDPIRQSRPGFIIP